MVSETRMVELGDLIRFRLDGQRAHDALRLLEDQLTAAHELNDQAVPSWWHLAYRPELQLLSALKQVALDSVSSMQQLDPDHVPF